MEEWPLPLAVIKWLGSVCTVLCLFMSMHLALCHVGGKRFKKQVESGQVDLKKKKNKQATGWPFFIRGKKLEFGSGQQISACFAMSNQNFVHGHP